MKKLSKQEKVNRGTYEKCKERKFSSFDPLTVIPEPAEPLNPGELSYFNRCCEAMISNRTLCGAYLLGITRASHWFGHYQGALKEVEANGCYQITQSGYTAKNGQFQVLCECEKILTAFERSNGLNLTAQSKLPAAPEPEKHNPFDDI